VDSWIHVCVREFMYMYAFTCVCVHVCHVCVYVRVSVLCVCVCVCVFVCVCVHLYIQTSDPSACSMGELFASIYQLVMPSISDDLWRGNRSEV